ncbi:MAG TPA: family 43 glycosylhydrolase [Alkalispirochaeta sp.]|nr:family 43 glycosylhydrolase [Alkalispirochaeta sp.]
MRLTNPLIDTPGMADPHALVIRDSCYLFTGHDVGVGVHDWVMPDWRIYRSDDLLTWTHVGTISPADNYMGAGSTACWAGDIACVDGTYYWFFSNGNRETGVMVASRPEGPYRDPLGGPLVDSFDPTIFIDDDRTAYLIYGMGEYKIARLADNMIELAEEPHTIALDRTGAFPHMDKNSLHKHDDRYYLSCSGHYAVADNVYGPYSYRGTVGTGWQLESPYAHGDFFVYQNLWYHVWCRYRDRRVDRIRDCFIAPVTYDAEGNMWDILDDLPPSSHGFY